MSVDKKSVDSKEDTKTELVKKEDVLPKNFSDTVMNSIHDYTSKKRLQLPANYSAENALKSAWLMIQGTVDKNGIPALTACKDNGQSIANALLEMVIMGLNPAKSQCYFIVRGNKLTLFPSYFGKITTLKRIKGIEDVNAQVIYAGDEIDYEINSDGSISDIEHHQKFENIKEDKIIGAWCVIKYKGQEYGTIATMEQIQEAWNESQWSKNKTKFKSEFAKRTVVNKAAKWFVNTRDDEDLLIETITANENQHYSFDGEQQESQEELPGTKMVIIDEDKSEPNSDISDKPIGEEDKNVPKVAQFE